MIGIIIGILITGIIISVIFGSLGWVVGMFNRNLNSNQRSSWGFYITVFFIFMIIMRGCAWSNGEDRLEEKRQTVWRQNIPYGYYDVNSPNFGNDEAIDNNSNINNMNAEIEAYDEKMAYELLFWILGYIALVFIGLVGSIVYPLE